MAKKRVDKFSKAFRQYAVVRLKQFDNLVELSKELGIHRRLLYMWREQWSRRKRAKDPRRLPVKRRSARRSADLKRGVGGQDAGGRFFRRCLAHSKGATPAERRLWRDGICAHIRGVMSQQGNLSIERMCQLAPVSRAGFYRSLQEGHPA